MEGLHATVCTWADPDVFSTATWTILIAGDRVLWSTLKHKLRAIVMIWQRSALIGVCEQPQAYSGPPIIVVAAITPAITATDMIIESSRNVLLSSFYSKRV
ncbi:hypothetical protein K503DRAFT_390401 [Rhizopogon vinicolor AM-OR11-026]|uniref:Uncharacterized protein n=1 Tax=Rhizopogon vinicolor AM-OR11-026 TaxID=1314800 RepID=A0A1B7MRI7_9AGAM|nr:hypothetical protein K503DRAFT_390401 [Rhizopogon vinicolor AM-OR11-026]